MFKNSSYIIFCVLCVLSSCIPQFSADSTYLESTDSSSVTKKNKAVGKWEIHPYKANTPKRLLMNETSYFYAYFDKYGYSIYPELIYSIRFKGATLTKIGLPNSTINPIEMNGLYRIENTKGAAAIDTLYFENGYLKWSKYYYRNKLITYINYSIKYKNERFSYYLEAYTKNTLYKYYIIPRYLDEFKYSILIETVSLR